MKTLYNIDNALTNNAQMNVKEKLKMCETAKWMIQLSNMKTSTFDISINKKFNFYLRNKYEKHCIEDN